RTKNKVADLLEEGVKWTNTPKGIAENAEIIITMVGYPHDVEEVYFGNNGIFAGAKKGLIAIDMTTSTPTLAKQIFEKGQKIGIHTLDAPVSGGDIGASKGTLSIMVGGERQAFDESLPIFSAMGE